MSYKLVRSERPITAKLQQLRHDGVLTDITFQVGDRKFPVHKLVLHDTTPFLTGVFAEHFPVDDHVYRIDEEFVEPEMMELLLTYFYTGEITLTPDNAHALCIAAHFFQASDLVSACEKYLSGKVSADTVLELTILADRLELNILLDRCIDQFRYRLSLLRDDRLKQLSKKSAELLISKLYQKEVCHVAAGAFMDKWTQHNPEARADLNITLPVYQPRDPRGNDHLFCIGGASGMYNNRRINKLMSVSRFDSDTEQWETVCEMPRRRMNFAGTVFGTRIFICGGWHNGNNRSFAVYSCLNDTWTELPEMPFRPDDSLTAVAKLRGKIYFTGGYSDRAYDDADDAGKQPAFEYNPQNQKWKRIKSMIVPRGGHRMVAIDDALYVIGGRNGGNTVERHGSPWSDVYRWTMVAPTNYHHENHAVAVHNGRIYVYSQAGFEVYDPNWDTWRTLSKADTEENCGSTLASFDGQLLLIGGSISSNSRFPSTANIYSYDVKLDQWSVFRSMDVARAEHCSFVVKYG